MTQDAVVQGNDLTMRMTRFLDIHMVLHFIDFLKEAELQPENVLQRARISCLEQTKMVEALQDVVQELPADSPLKAKYASMDWDAKRDATLQALDEQEAQLAPVFQFFQQESVINDIIKGGNQLTPEYLAAQHNINAQQLEAFYSLAKFKYECGLYDEAEQMLSKYMLVHQPTNHGKVLSCHWGRLAARILLRNVDAAFKDLTAVKEAIDNRSIAPAEQLHQRSWLLHWSLFVFFNQPQGQDNLVDFFTERPLLQTVENKCPWLLRYFVASVILSKRKRNSMRPMLVEEIRQMSYLYSDPFTQFVEQLYDQFDFDAAQETLKDCYKIAKADFFLAPLADRFRDEATKMIFEAYCQIHHKVDISALANKLDMSQEEAEKCIVDLVRNSTLDARIDSSTNSAVVRSPDRDPHQKIVERTRDLTQRSTVLGQNIDRVFQDQGLYLSHILLGRSTEH